MSIWRIMVYVSLFGAGTLLFLVGFLVAVNAPWYWIATEAVLAIIAAATAHGFHRSGQ